jgi:hypothetical protein
MGGYVNVMALTVIPGVWMEFDEALGMVCEEEDVGE